NIRYTSFYRAGAMVMDTSSKPGIIAVTGDNGSYYLNYFKLSSGLSNIESSKRILLKDLASNEAITALDVINMVDIKYSSLLVAISCQFKQNTGMLFVVMDYNMVANSSFFIKTKDNWFRNILHSFGPYTYTTLKVPNEENLKLLKYDSQQYKTEMLSFNFKADISNITSDSPLNDTLLILSGYAFKTIALNVDSSGNLSPFGTCKDFKLSPYSGTVEKINLGQAIEDNSVTLQSDNVSGTYSKMNLEDITNNISSSVSCMK
ncbi:MAG: hypothetical protein N3B13_03530, partial [Deltaproteobacteria bacterium]|nr:hypothetical protein [Deltaproteobacteria bacterium]